MSTQPMVKSRLKLVLHEFNGERMRRGEQPLTVRELAALANLSPSVVSGLSSNRAAQVHFTTLDKLCRVLNVKPGDLLEYTPEPTPASVE